MNRYLNEVARRVDVKNRSLGQIMKQEFMPFLDIEYYLGLPRDLEGRVSPLVGYPPIRAITRLLLPRVFQRLFKDPSNSTPSTPESFSKSESTSKIPMTNEKGEKHASPIGHLIYSFLFNRKSIPYRALAGSNPKQIRVWPFSHNRREIWASEGPSYGGITNAKSVNFINSLVLLLFSSFFVFICCIIGHKNIKQLAKLSAILANNGTLDGKEWISHSTLKKAFHPLPWMKDTVISRNVTFCVGGWGINFKFPGTEHVDWIGWGGIGGSMVWFNPVKNIAFSYLMNSLSMAGIGDTRSWKIIGALIESVEELERTKK